MATSTWAYWNTSSTDTGTSYNSSDGSWIAWNTSTSTSTTTSNNVWHYWTVDSTTDATVYTHDETWSSWTAGNTIQIVEGDFCSQRVDKRRLRVKAKRNRIRAEKQRRKQKARNAIADMKRHNAEETAKKLLLDLIGTEQMEVYKRTGRVFVKGREFDWLLITEGNLCKLKKITKDKVYDLCIHIDADLIPKTDQVIGYLLNAKFNEKHLEKTANLVRVNDKKDFEERIKDAANA